MIFKRKKSSADKAFELCVDLLGEMKKQGRAIEVLAEEIRGIKGSLIGMEEFLTENITDCKDVVNPVKEVITLKIDELSSAQTQLYLCVKETRENVCEVGRLVSDLKNGVMAYGQKKEDAVTVAQILDEYLNGGKEEQ